MTNPIVPSPPDAPPTIRLESILDPLPLDTFFPVPQPVEVELGSGDGSFLVHYAASRPHRNFLGIERLLGRLRKIERKTTRRRLTNVRLIRIEAAYLLEYLLPPQSIASLHVYFPDPWPKRKQQKNRLVNERFPTLAARVLAPGGTVYLRTDDVAYFSQMTTVFASHSEFATSTTPIDLETLLTDFEKDFLAQGIPTLRAAYQRRTFNSKLFCPEPSPPR